MGGLTPQPRSEGKGNTACEAVPMRLVAGLALLVLGPGCTRDGASREAMEKKLSGIQTGEERQIAPDTFMKMHRVQATQPLGDGWQLAASTEGGFSVELPLPFNDFRIRSEAADHVQMRMHTVGAKTPGKLAWSATCAVRADGRRGGVRRRRTRWGDALGPNACGVDDHGPHHLPQDVEARSDGDSKDLLVTLAVADYLNTAPPFRSSATNLSRAGMRTATSAKTQYFS